MVEFASTLLPVRYQSERQEHLAVRHAVGVFDISHMGEIFVTGNKAAAFLQKVLTNNVYHLINGQAQYTLMLNADGGIIDDLIVYRLREDNFLLCVNAANIHKDFRHLVTMGTTYSDLQIDNASDQVALLALQGPNAPSLLQSLTDQPLPKRYFIDDMDFFGIKTKVARTGYTGEDGFEIFLDNSQASSFFELLLDRGKAFSLTPCGLAARDSLRLEAGLLLYGQDMDEAITPLEAGIMFAVDLNKEDFIGKNALISEKLHGLKKKLMGFHMLEKGIARHGHRVLDLGQNEIGVVTSGTLPPEKPLAIGLAYIHIDHAQRGQTIQIDIRGRLSKAQLSSTRFR